MLKPNDVSQFFFFLSGAANESAKSSAQFNMLIKRQYTKISHNTMDRRCCFDEVGKFPKF